MDHEISEARGETNEENGEEESEMNFSGSEEMRFGISRIHEKVEAFNQLVIMFGELCYFIPFASLKYHLWIYGYYISDK